MYAKINRLLFIYDIRFLVKTDTPREGKPMCPSGMRDLNPRSSAWQADALPTKLIPHIPRLSGVSNNDFWLGGAYRLLVRVARLELARVRLEGFSGHSMSPWPYHYVVVWTMSSPCHF